MPSVFVVHSSLRSLSQNTLCARNRLQRELGEENDINCTTEGAPGFVLPTRRKISNQGLTATSEINHRRGRARRGERIETARERRERRIPSDS